MLTKALYQQGKTCAKCSTYYPDVQAGFYLNHRRKGGRLKYAASRCKACLIALALARHRQQGSTPNNPLCPEQYEVVKTRARNRYRNASPEKKQRIYATQSNYRSRFPEKRAAIRHRRRARIQSSSEHFTSAEWLALLDRCDHKCLACGSDDRKLTVDHVVPLSLGGSNGIHNIQPLCGSCNSSKKNRVIDYRIPK